MTRHRNATLRSATLRSATVRNAIRRLRPSPGSVAAAAAVYDPAMLLALEATRRRSAGGTPARGRRRARPHAIPAPRAAS